jgi:hypothetical protein
MRRGGRAIVEGSTKYDSTYQYIFFYVFGWCLPGKVLQDVAPYLVHQLVTAAARLRFCLGLSCYLGATGGYYCTEL